MSQYRATPSPILPPPPQKNILGQEVLKTHAILYNPISALNVRESPNFFFKSGSENTMVTSDFRLKVEIRLVHTCALKNMQYNPYLWPNCRIFRVLKETWIEEHSSDIRF